MRLIRVLAAAAAMVTVVAIGPAAMAGTSDQPAAVHLARAGGGFHGGGGGHGFGFAGRGGAFRGGYAWHGGRGYRPRYGYLGGGYPYFGCQYPYSYGYCTFPNG
jgi:hypothetical protein